MNTKAPSAIAWSRVLETFLIVLVPGLIGALGVIQSDVSKCAPPLGAVPCVIHWEDALYVLALAIVAGMVNGLTALLSALQNAHNTNAAAIAAVAAPATVVTPIIPPATPASVAVEGAPQ
jgi:hypothetical protein